MKTLFNLAIFTKKEIMQLLIDEKRVSYRKGYKAGAAMRYRHSKPEVSAQVTDENGMPTVYGDSLPVKEPEVTEKVIVHIGDVWPVETNTVTDSLTYR